MSTQHTPDHRDRTPAGPTTPGAGTTGSLRSSLHGIAESAGSVHRDRRRQGLGLPSASLVAAARRRRRRFTAGAAAVGTAAVAAVAFSGVALAGLPDGGTQIEPSDWAIPYGLCGSTVDQVTRGTDTGGLALEITAAAPAIGADEHWTATAEVSDAQASDDERRGGHLSDVVLLVVQDGVVVGLQAEPVAMRGTPVDLGTGDVATTSVDVGLVGCDAAAASPLAPGEYEVYAQQTWAPEELSTDEASWARLVGGPVALTVAAAGTEDPATWAFPECGTTGPDRDAADGSLLDVTMTLRETLSTTSLTVDFETITVPASGRSVTYGQRDVVLAFVRDGRVVATVRPESASATMSGASTAVTAWSAPLLACADPLAPLAPGEYTVWPALLASVQEVTEADGTPVEAPAGARWHVGRPQAVTVTAES